MWLCANNEVPYVLPEAWNSGSTLAFFKKDIYSCHNDQRDKLFEARINKIFHKMNKTEIAEALRNEVGELELSIKKLQARCESLKTFVLDLESEIAGPIDRNQKMVEDSKFRKMVDYVFGEKPKRPRH